MDPLPHWTVLAPTNLFGVHWLSALTISTPQTKPTQHCKKLKTGKFCSTFRTTPNFPARGDWSVTRGQGFFWNKFQYDRLFRLQQIIRHGSRIPSCQISRSLLLAIYIRFSSTAWTINYFVLSKICHPLQKKKGGYHTSFFFAWVHPTT